LRVLLLARTVTDDTEDITMKTKTNVRAGAGDSFE
jgi:hypothetical protein